jgi:hypothetical protein
MQPGLGAEAAHAEGGHGEINGSNVIVTLSPRQSGDSYLHIDDDHQTTAPFVSTLLFVV